MLFGLQNEDKIDTKNNNFDIVNNLHELMIKLNFDHTIHIHEFQKIMKKLDVNNQEKLN